MKPKLFLISVFGLWFAACSGKQIHIPDIETAQMAIAGNPYPRGMVVAANPYAVDAGVSILRKGGSAVDAAIAVQTVLGLVEPQSSGIGGGAFLVFYDAKTGKVTAYNGRETAPLDIDQTLFEDEKGEPIRFFDGIASGRSTGVPGVIAMLKMAHDEHGKLPWADGFTFATRLAENGFVISPRLADMVKRFGDYALKKHAAARAYFFDKDGNPVEAGFVRDNKPYAQSLRLIARDTRHMYGGKISEAIVKVVGEEPRPGTLTLADFRAYKPTRATALCSPYRDHILCGPHPPSSGGVAVQSLMGQLEHFDMKALGPTLQGWHVFAEASELAYADRDLYVADPEHVDVPVRAMLDPEYLESRSALIKMDRAFGQAKSGNPVQFVRGRDATPDNPGTSHFSIVDKQGNVASMTTTVEAPFGSKRMAAGFILNNQLTDFSFRARDADGHLIANRPGPGKRPRSSMSPHIVFDKNGDFAFATGSPGGNSIIAYTAKTIIAMIDWGMDPQEAVGLANFVSRNGSIRLEETGLASDIIEGLEHMGHNVVRSRSEISGLHVIRRNPDGSYDGAADPRREGVVGSE